MNVDIIYFAICSSIKYYWHRHDVILNVTPENYIDCKTIVDQLKMILYFKLYNYVLRVYCTSTFVWGSVLPLYVGT